MTLEECAEKIHEVEKRALVLDRSAILEIVSLERMLREKVIELMKARHRDGAIDGATTDHCLSELDTYLDDRFGPEVES